MPNHGDDMTEDALALRAFSQRARRAAGQPISDLMSRALANPDLISLAAGFVDQQTLPVELTRVALDHILSDPTLAREALQYGTTPGYLPLRRTLLEELVERDGGAAGAQNLTEDQVVITAGSNQLLHLVCDSLCDDGDIVLCAAPTYLVVLGTLANIGARAYGVASDAHGIVPEALEDALTHLEKKGDLPRVKAVYVVTYFDNPRGVTMPLHRRENILEIAQRWSRSVTIRVIEDVAYRELRFEGEDIPSLRSLDERGDTVVLAGTFSKAFSPGIRVGWGILPQDLVAPVCEQKGNLDFGSPNLNQHLIAQLLADGAVARHVQTLQREYQTKRDVMLHAMDELLASIPGIRWQKPAGGLYIWVELPDALDAGPDGVLLEVSLAEGVLYVPGQYCYPSEGQPAVRNRLRLSFGVQSVDNIRLGIETLARAVRRVSG